MSQPAVPAERAMVPVSGGTAGANVDFLNSYGNDPKTVYPEKTGPQTVDSTATTVEDEKEKGKEDKKEKDKKPPEVPVTNIPSDKKPVEKARDFIIKLPTPGSLLFPILVILFIWIFLVRFNGKARLQWFWEVLAGSAEVRPQAKFDASAAANPATAAGGVGDTSGQAGMREVSLSTSFAHPSRASVSDLDASTFHPQVLGSTPIAATVDY